MYAQMYLFVISLCQGLYLNISWWGDFTHIMAGLVVASIVFIGLCLMESRSPGHVTFGSNLGLLFVMFLAAMSFGGIWEMMEAMTDVISGKLYMVYRFTDTIADITADMIGIFVMVVIAGIILKTQRAAEVTSKIGLDRNSIEY